MRKILIYLCGFSLAASIGLITSVSAQELKIGFEYGSCF